MNETAAPRPERPSDPKMRHPMFTWGGNGPGATVSLLNLDGPVKLQLHAQYTANDTVHLAIVKFLLQEMSTRPDVCVMARDWDDEAKRLDVALFFKRRLRRAVRAADKLDDAGDLAVWVEIEKPPVDVRCVIDEASDVPAKVWEDDGSKEE